jgi:hypothetical protein
VLYPKNEKPLAEENFKNPSCEYRAAPFWGWNNKLNAEELVWQIEKLKQLGFGGFHMHVRTGLATEYLGDDYMSIVGACVEKARTEKMLAWLYDEDRWPSGAAGGIVTKNEKYRQRHLLLTRHAYVGNSNRIENGILLACFDITLNTEGLLKQYRRINENDTVSGFKLYAYIESDRTSPWYNNQTYVNTLDPEAVKEFISVTHECYRKYFSGEFGGIIPAIFTDEPQFSQKETFRFAHEDRDITIPWTDDIEETFKSAYPGESLLDGIPELLWDMSENRISIIRYHYHDHVAERFTAAFADQCGSWCDANGLMLTGHMMEEPTLKSQTHAVGDAMRTYRSFQLPGIDMLCDRREFTTAKQAQSVARQYGRPGVLSELYGVTNWDFDFRGHKLQGDWQVALGVTVRVPHLSWVSMNGEAKRDYPGTFNYQAPWFREYPYVEDHFARINTALTRGKAVVRVGVIHPIESYWLHWGPGENTLSIREQMDQKFLDLCDWLLRGLIDFDYICESTLPALCNIDRIKPDAPFPVGKMGYDIVIVPELETIRETTLVRLEAYHKAGGCVLFLGVAPKYLDAKPGELPLRFWEQSERLGFDRLSLLDSLATIRDLEIRNDSGTATQNLLYQMREEADNSRWLFIAHADKPVNPDIPCGDTLRIRVKGRWSVIHYDSITGNISPLPSISERGNTVILFPFYDHDSLLLKLEERKNESSDKIEMPNVITPAPYPYDTRSCVRFTAPVPVTLHESNVLLLDIAEFALDDEPYRAAEEVLRLDTILRTELGWPVRKKIVAQPWIENDTSVPHRLKLRYIFESEIEIDGAELALENASRTSIRLNGEAALPADGWYVDRCIGKVKLPVIKRGSNCLEMILLYGRKTDVEACYLLGDFGVRVNGIRCTLNKPVRELAFGDISRQGLAFYGGNITYHLEAESRNGRLTISITSYRGHLLRVRVDGKDKGVIAYSPYVLTVDRLEDGLHQIELIYFGCRINTFGQLHGNVRDNGFWWGPDSWRSSGPAWTYEYRFWTQGILKSPEIN